MRIAVLRVKVENEILGREDRKKVAMSVARAETQFGSWMIEGHSPRIEYLPSVLEEICAVAVEGLSRLRRGGVEVGGVLFGVRDGEAVRILAFRPTPCEHAVGPSFLLSEKDRRALENVLEFGEARPRAARPGTGGVVPLAYPQRDLSLRRRSRSTIATSRNTAKWPWWCGRSSLDPAGRAFSSARQTDRFAPSPAIVNSP